MAPISCQKEKYEGKKIEVGENKKVRLEIHLIKADHGVAKGEKPLIALPQLLPIGFTEKFVEPLDKKTKMKRELSTTVRDIRKPTHRISTQVNSEKLLFTTGVPLIHHEALLRNKLVALNTHSLLPFLKALLHGLFSLVHLGGRLEKLYMGNNIFMGSIAMTGNGRK